MWLGKGREKKASPALGQEQQCKNHPKTQKKNNKQTNKKQKQADPQTDEPTIQPIIAVYRVACMRLKKNRKEEK